MKLYAITATPIKDGVALPDMEVTKQAVDTSLAEPIGMAVISAMNNAQRRGDDMFNPRFAILVTFSGEVPSMWPNPGEFEG